MDEIEEFTKWRQKNCEQLEKAIELENEKKKLSMQLMMQEMQQKVFGSQYKKLLSQFGSEEGQNTIPILRITVPKLQEPPRNTIKESIAKLRRNYDQIEQEATQKREKLVSLQMEHALVNRIEPEEEMLPYEEDEPDLSIDRALQQKKDAMISRFEADKALETVWKELTSLKMTEKRLSKELLDLNHEASNLVHAGKWRPYVEIEKIDPVFDFYRESISIP